MKKIIFVNRIEERKIKQASQILQEGKILIHPTENLYGFGAIISSETAIKKIEVMKKRKEKSGFIVLIGNFSQIHSLVCSISTSENELIKKYWPGPLTIILNAKKKYWQRPICYNKTIAVRLVGNEITREIINKVGTPIISTSINISGEKEALKTEDIITKFESQIDGIVIDKIHTFTNKPSTIVKVVNQKIKVVREGAVTL
ncbi:MAG: L-threonylcarbamoyladenylate synthase [Candidatus Cloacimonadota bacterium]|nr:L-threonylcarbamoyladenylate synthase [Candidatus Cloacimonadota bacterium]